MIPCDRRGSVRMVLRIGSQTCLGNRYEGH